MLKAKGKTMLAMNKKQSYGFSLVELLVGMVIGLVIVSGAFSLHSTSRKTQVKNEEQMDMVADARFAIEMIAYDLRHAGMWGGTNKDSLVKCRSTDTSCKASSASEAIPSTVAGDCEAGWYYNLSEPVYGITGAVNNVYATCVTDRRSGTDMLTVRYADSNQPAALVAGQAYVRSNFINGRVFVGTTAPVLEANDANVMTRNYELRSHLYYISKDSDSTGDGIPSLRRAALVNGPKIEDQLVVSGVYNFQVAFGEDVNNDSKIDRYVEPAEVVDWNNVYAAKIWLVMRTDKIQNITATKSFTLDGVTANYGDDGYRYFMVSSVVDMRNLRQL